jgi:hypothetical protein
LLLTSPIEADAQIIGGRIGVTLFDNMRGMTGVGYMAFPLDRWFSLQPELLYSEKGTKGQTFSSVQQDPNTGQIQYLDNTVYWDHRYLELPLLASLNLPLTRKFALSVAAGPSAALRVDCAWKLRTTVVSQFGEEMSETTEALEGDPCDGFKRMNLGFVLGGGAGLGSDHIKFIIDLRRSIDFGQMKSHVFAATIGVGLRR